MLDAGYSMLDEEVLVYRTGSLIDPFYVPFLQIE
jgi:hypothetical protein